MSGRREKVKEFQSFCETFSMVGMSGAHQAALSLPFLVGRGGERIRKQLIG